MRPTPLLACLALVGACIDDAAPSTPDVTQAVLSGFVRTATDGAGHPRFSGNGKVFRFVGANINELPWLDAGGQDQELAWAASMGFKVIRVWGVDDRTDVNAMAARLRTTLDLAAARGLYVTIALTHNYHQVNFLNPQSFHAVPGDARASGWAGGVNGFYERDIGGGLICLGDDWIDWGYTANYRQYATQLVSLLRDHPAIFSWDIANEVSASSAGAFIVGRLASFYTTMAGLIKGADHNHLVTTGMISTSWAGMPDAQRDAVYNSANIDYLTVHEYDGADSNTYDHFSQTDEIWRANNRYHKPVVVEEFGAAGANVQASITSYYQRRLQPADASKAATGVMYFGVSSPARTWMSDGTWFTATQRAFLPGLWQSWSATLAAESGGGGGGGGCVALAPGASLLANQTKGSCDGAYTLAYQPDGNFVLYRNGVGAVWSACTDHKGAPGGAFMQTDGNLVVYPASGPSVWDAHTAGHPNARLLFEANGLVLRDASTNASLWTSNGPWCQ